MTVITDITIQSEQFALGRLFDTFPDATVELERLVPLDGKIIPLFWVEHPDKEGIKAMLRADTLTESVSVFTDLGGRYLFEEVWNEEEINAVVIPLIESKADILRAVGTADSWSFRLQFKNHEHLGKFRRRCRDGGVTIHLDALYNPTVPSEEAAKVLSDEQYDIIATAYDEGFWEIPRGVTMGELADSIGISSNAASQRMRRGLSAIVGREIAANRGQSTEKPAGRDGEPEEDTTSPDEDKTR